MNDGNMIKVDAAVEIEKKVFKTIKKSSRRYKRMPLGLESSLQETFYSNLAIYLA
jgi:hypothetical protein